ncbi:CAMKK/ELM protein kinase Ssp1 [Schizosaccharomyces cryophilus OY26]|uniref:non-specific serine/threonine protein kinase n=1 Tax=Schizosaccharomyces cryophilus (strain OY26 / ATCC MYA-4695 / CBS 11777 / NBRC 106824 / NRRL Y48691) TaxID=653667 RepID=S9W268_SCHCR|nr:CAMKK/ELM protein kinase Ssp1 [Schizosaccharomyces cryophilus OY26]EPY52130.1 CAMKK/ELM protein kinase Ssp1 [Schizosaccharomyces cryophilus OY26]
MLCLPNYVLRYLSVIIINRDLFMGSSNNDQKLNNTNLLRKHTWHPETNELKRERRSPGLPGTLNGTVSDTNRSDSFRKRNYSAGDYVISPGANGGEGSSLTHSWTFQPGRHNQGLYSNNFREAQRQWKRLQEWGEVKETKKIKKRFDRFSGRKFINDYEIVSEIGRGMHGKVKLGREVNTKALLAIKIIPKTERRPKLGRANSSSQKEKVRREIAILKKCIHPNVVRLREVIDDPNSTKVYLVLEYMNGGEIQWTENQSPLLSVEQARQYFRDVVCGLEYLHYQGIIHRDIKPANLLLSSSTCVKISDFGVSYIARSGLNEENDVELVKTVGTPAFFAPELCWTDLDRPRPKISEAIDVWALGATLFCLLFGRCPFQASTEYELFDKIVNEPLQIPSTPEIGEDGHDLLNRLLSKDPSTRITLAEVKRHPWTIRDMPDYEEWIKGTNPEASGRVEVSNDEVASAVSLVGRLRKKLSKLFRFRRPKTQEQEVSSSPSDSSFRRENDASNSSLALSITQLSDSFNHMSMDKQQRDASESEEKSGGKGSVEEVQHLEKPKIDFNWDRSPASELSDPAEANNEDVGDEDDYDEESSSEDQSPNSSKMHSRVADYDVYSQASMEPNGDPMDYSQEVDFDLKKDQVPMVAWRDYERLNKSRPGDDPEYHSISGFLSSNGLPSSQTRATPSYYFEHPMTSSH